MSEIAEITEPVRLDTPAQGPQSTQGPRSNRATKKPLFWLCTAGVGLAALSCGVLFTDQATSWLAGIWRPETLAMMLSTAVGLASWAATRNWSQGAEGMPVPPHEDISRSQAVVRDRLGRGLVEASERRQYHFRRHLEVGVVRDLDGVATLAALLQKRLAQQDRPEASDVAKIRELVERTISEARLLAAEAYPPEIETQGLEAALLRMAGEAEKYHAYCRVVEGSACPKTDAATSLQLYRVVQAIVERAIQQGKAHHILIELAAGPEKYMSMTVTDRVGHGDKLPELTESESSDLMARVRSIGGAMHVEYPAGGLRVTCRMMAKGPKLQS